MSETLSEMSEGVSRSLREIHETLDQIAAQLKVRYAPLPLMLSREEAAFQLSIGLTTLKGLMRDGFIVGCQVGGRTMIPLAEIERIAAGGLATQGAKPAKQPPPNNTKAEAKKVLEALRRSRKKKKPTPP